MKIYETPCKHAFDDKCFLEWANHKIDRLIKHKKKKLINPNSDQEEENIVDLFLCPNCNHKIFEPYIPPEKKHKKALSKGAPLEHVELADHKI